MTAPAYMPMYWGDYLADTGHLSRDEHGAYLLLIAHYWQRQSALPDDDKKLARVARATPEEWHGHLREALEEFFVIENGFWRHSRVEREIETFNERYRKQSEAGKRGRQKQLEDQARGTPKEPPDNPHGDAQPTSGQPTSTPTSSVSKDTGREAPASDPLKDLFDTAVKILGDADVSPKHARSKLGQWRKTYDDGEIFNALVEARKNSAVEPIAYVEKTLRKRSGGDKPFPGYVPLGVGG